MGKKDRKAIESVLYHCERDMGYGDGGSFGNDNPKMARDIAEAQRGIECVRWILATYLDE